MAVFMAKTKAHAVIASMILETKVFTFDGAQGEEAEYVLADTVTSSSPGFLKQV